MDSVNQKCLEQILCKLTAIIQLSEGENVKELCKLVDAAIEVSAQLSATTGECVDEDGDDEPEEVDDDEFGELEFCIKSQ